MSAPTTPVAGGGDSMVHVFLVKQSAGALPGGVAYEGRVAAVESEAVLDGLIASLAGSDPELRRRVGRPRHIQRPPSDGVLGPSRVTEGYTEVATLSLDAPGAFPPEVAYRDPATGALYVADGIGTLRDVKTGAVLYHGCYKHGMRHGGGKGRVYDREVFGGAAEVAFVGTYEGAWAAGLRHGRGTFIEDCGSRWEGEWARDTLHGEGLEYLPGGGSLRANWSRGNLAGCAVFTWPTGARTEYRQYAGGSIVATWGGPALEQQQAALAAAQLAAAAAAAHPVPHATAAALAMPRSLSTLALADHAAAAAGGVPVVAGGSGGGGILGGLRPVRSFGDLAGVDASALAAAAAAGAASAAAGGTTATLGVPVTVSSADGTTTTVALVPIGSPAKAIGGGVVGATGTALPSPSAALLAAAPAVGSTGSSGGAAVAGDGTGAAAGTAAAGGAAAGGDGTATTTATTALVPVSIALPPSLAFASPGAAAGGGVRPTMISMINADVLRFLKHSTVNDVPGGRAGSSRSIIGVRKDDTVETCLTRMSENNVLSLPVFDASADKYVAIIHMLDIFAFMLDLVAKKKASFSPQATMMGMAGPAGGAHLRGIDALMGGGGGGGVPALAGGGLGSAAAAAHHHGSGGRSLSAHSHGGHGDHSPREGSTLSGIPRSLSTGTGMAGSPLPSPPYSSSLSSVTGGGGGGGGGGPASGPASAGAHSPTASPIHSGGSGSAIPAFHAHHAHGLGGFPGGGGGGPGGGSIASSLREALAHQRRFASAPISEVLEMSTHLTPTAFRPLPERAPLIYATQTLSEGAHAVPIVNTSGTIVRMLTQADIIRFLAAHLDELGPMATMTLADLGITGHPENLVIARFSDKAMDVLTMMRAKRAPAAPVVDSYGAMAANISFSDVKAIARKANFNALQLPLQAFFAAIDKGGTAVMSPSIYVKAGSIFSSVLLTMAATKIHQLYFVDDALHPVGTIRTADLLKLFVATGDA